MTFSVGGENQSFIFIFFFGGFSILSFIFSFPCVGRLGSGLALLPFFQIVVALVWAFPF